MMKLQRQDQLKKAVFKLLYHKGALSLAELSEHTKKSTPNISSIVNNLITEGYVVEHGLAPSTGGRRPLKYLLNKQKKEYIVSVAMDQFVTRLVIYNLLNHPIIPETHLTLPLQDNPNALDILIEFINNTLTNSSIKNSQILGVGIGMPGFVNIEKGVNSSYLPTPHNAAGLRVEMSNRIGLPVYIENDSSTIAIAELHFGAAKGLQDAMVVNMGWGIGLGMIVNGSLFRGHNGYAGEFSHIPLSQSSKLCPCGKRGCLEVEASLLVAVENAKQAMAEGTKSSLEKLFADVSKPEGDHLIDGARQGDQLAVTALSDAVSIMGKGIATLIHIMNPERIVISGRGAAAGKLLLPPIGRAINEFCIPKLAEQTDIVVSNLTYQAELLGAASLVVENCVLTSGSAVKGNGQLKTPSFS